jgi:hypothetical protein
MLWFSLCRSTCHGHTLKLIAPKDVNASARRSRHNATDTAAICEAVAAKSVTVHS